MDRLTYMKICSNLGVAAYMDADDDLYDNRIFTTDEIISMMVENLTSNTEDVK